MKKVLFATTALIATAGVASADITLTGGAIMGYKDTGTAASTGAHVETDFNIVASGTSDNGLTFGATLDLDGDTVDASGTAGKTHSGTIGDPEVYVSGAFGTVTFGDLAVATDIGISDVGFDGIGAEDLAKLNANQGSADMSWSYSMNGVSLFVTADSVTDDTSFSIGYSANGFSATVAQSNDNDTNDTGTVVTGSYTANGLTLAAMVTSYDDANATSTDTRGTGVYVSYAVTPELTIAALASNNDNGSSADTDSNGVGFAYNLGGGMSLKGGVGENGSNESVFDLGLAMSF